MKRPGEGDRFHWFVRLRITTVDQREDTRSALDPSQWNWRELLDLGPNEEVIAEVWPAESKGRDMDHKITLTCGQLDRLIVLVREARIRNYGDHLSAELDGILYEAELQHKELLHEANEARDGKSFDAL